MNPPPSQDTPSAPESSRQSQNIFEAGIGQPGQSLSKGLCHLWIAADGTIHVQNLTPPLAALLSQLSPNDPEMRFRALTQLPPNPPLATPSACE